jgi:SH3 domain protein
MTRTCFVAGMLLLPAIACAQDGGKQQYISDDISITVRDGPRNDAASVGSVNSGDKVTVLESLGEASFARIRTADGRTGWITSRYLSGQPAAKDRTQGLQTELTASRNQLKSLQAELDAAQGRLENARPAMEVAADNEKLKADLATAQQQNEDAQIHTNEQRAERRTMVTGAALVGGGILLGLILPLMGRGGGRRKRRNEL